MSCDTFNMSLKICFMSKVIIFLIVISSFSCSSPKKNYLDFFPITDTLCWSKLENISSDLLGKPRDIFIVDNYFVVRDEKEGNWFSLIRKSDGHFIRYFGVRGRGPLEILYPLNQEPLGRNFYIYDSSQEILHLFSLDSLLQQKNGITRSVHLQFKTDKHAQCRQAVLLESGNILANCCHPNGHLVMFDSTGNEQKVFCPDYPKDGLHPKEDYITKSFAFQYMGVMGKNNKFYNLSTTAGHIEIFRLKNDSLFQFVNDLYYLPKYENASANKNYGVVFAAENEGGLFNPEVSEHYLYAAYDDRSSDAHTYIAYNVLLQFDLEGRPTRCYHLSSRISRFFIDNKTIYAIGADPETLEPCIFYHKIE